MTTSWTFWALLSAFFAALTAILAKAGVESVNADYATLVRTIVVVIMAAAIVLGTGAWQAPGSLSGKTWTLLVLSGLATGASWLCFFRALKLGDASRVAPIDKLSIVLVAVFGVLFLHERLSPANWVGILMISGGAVLLAYRS